MTTVAWNRIDASPKKFKVCREKKSWNFLPKIFVGEPIGSFRTFSKKPCRRIKRQDFQGSMMSKAKSLTAGSILWTELEGNFFGGMYDNNGITGKGNNLISDWEKICLFWITLNSTKYNNPDEHENFPVSFHPPTILAMTRRHGRRRCWTGVDPIWIQHWGPEDDALVMTVCTTEMDMGILLRWPKRSGHCIRSHWKPDWNLLDTKLFGEMSVGERVDTFLRKKPVYVMETVYLCPVKIVPHLRPTDFETL